jgi:signal transduction histidine kinase
MLVLARVVWVALAVFSLAVLVTSLPGYVARLQSVCTGATCAYGQLNLASVQTVHDVGLSTMGEEERRRLRRDLHDELGPTLASLTLRIDAARNLLQHDTDEASRLLSDLKLQMQSTVADIRRLVYDLRPPALDELGLISALEEQAASYSQLHGLRVSLQAPEHLPPLSAAIEVAAYRIVLEALTNVARHAQAGSCRICLSLSDILCLEIVDDGLGLPQDYRASVGMTSMRERAAELGGSCVMEAAIPSGTRVCARLPFLS